MYWRDKPAFCFFFLLKEYPFGAKRKWGGSFLPSFLKRSLGLN